MKCFGKLKVSFRRQHGGAEGTRCQKSHLCLGFLICKGGGGSGGISPLNARISGKSLPRSAFWSVQEEAGRGE